MTNRITFFRLPLEIEKNPKLTKTDKDVAWIVFSVNGTNGHNHSCFYSNKNLAAMADCNPLTASRAIKKLVQEFVVISKVTVDKSVGFRRELSINPKYKEYGEKFVDEYNRKVEEQLGSRLIKLSIPIDKIINRGSEKSKDYGGLKNPYIIKIDNKDYPPLGDSGDLRTPPLTDTPSDRKEDKKMPVVNFKHSLDRLVVYWKSKNPPLVQPKDSTVIRKVKRLSPVIKLILTKYSESKIKDCIDIYHASIHNHFLLCGVRGKSSPFRVGFFEFFEFDFHSVDYIVRSEIKGFEKVTGWFDLCLLGEQEIESRFILMPKDKFPMVTGLLKKAVSTWDGHPTVVGNIPETQLRKGAVKLVEFHQRIKSRIQGHQRILQVSTPAFLKEYFVPYILNNINRDKFMLYWVQSDKFLYSFEQHLETIGAITRPPMVRNRRVGYDQSIPFGSGSRASYRNRDDHQCELSAADYKNI